MGTRVLLAVPGPRAVAPRLCIAHFKLPPTNEENNSPASGGFFNSPWVKSVSQRAVGSGRAARSRGTQPCCCDS